MSVAPRQYSAEDQLTWHEILSTHIKKRDKQICEIFLNGVQILGIDENQIPSLDSINKILVSRTGFSGVLVNGLEEGTNFFQLLSKRQFPVGNFIRSREHLSYTPAPDIVHDLYGHLPFFTDEAYANFCQSFGEEAMKFSNRPKLLRQFERFFWFSIEFGLVETNQGRRIFGAGIASSTAECNYALGGKPEVIPFSVDALRLQEFRIDIIQPKLFCLKSPEQLYNSLEELCFKIKKESYD